MASVSSDPAKALDLVTRVQAASDLAAGVAAVMDAVLAPRGVRRAAAVIERKGRLEVVKGVGWGEESVTEPDDIPPRVEQVVSECLGPYGAEGVVIPDATGRAFGMERYTVLPLPAAGEEKSCFGALVFDPGTTPAEVWRSETAGLIQVAGPALHRLAEIESLAVTSRQLDRQRELLTSLVNALPDPVLITDQESNVLLENLRAETLFTSEDSDSGGRRRAVEVNNLLFSSFLSRLELGGDEERARELNLVDPNEGGDLLFEVLSTPLPSSLLGEEGATVAVLRNVTDLKLAVTELEQQFKRARQAELLSRRERDRLNLILGNVGDPILVTDGGSNIVLMNREAERLFEAQDEDPRSNRRRSVRANDTKFTSLISEFALSTGQTQSVELDFADPETSNSIPMELVSGKILNEREETTAIVSIIHDRTKAVENERLASELGELNEDLENRVQGATSELEERNRQLEWQSVELARAYRLKSEFLASMSHELRTPINALLGYTSLMRDEIYGELNDRQGEALERMYGASQHLLELVSDILDLAKIEAGKMPVHVEQVQLDALVRELSETIEPMIHRKKLEYTVEIGGDVPALETDRTKVKQILLNLLSNAVKFTPEGKISVGARPDGDEAVEITVSDTGIGISEQNRDKIFEDFRQVDQSSTREYGGTGLGLSITKKLLELLDGTIWVESEEGKGSTFFVRLPLKSEEIALDDDDVIQLVGGDEPPVVGSRRVDSPRASG
ncbi:MAG: ATP-binding protein [Longimicrobiaceae bacterium]